MHQLHLTFIPTRICKTDHTKYTSKHTPGFLFLLHTHAHAPGPITGTLHERIIIIHQWKPVKYEI